MATTPAPHRAALRLPNLRHLPYLPPKNRVGADSHVLLHHHHLLRNTLMHVFFWFAQSILWGFLLGLGYKFADFLFDRIRYRIEDR